MIEIQINDESLLLSYTPELRDPESVRNKLNEGEPISIKNIFRPESKDLYSPLDTSENNETFIFVLGKLSGEYFQINNRIVNTTNTFYFHKSMSFAHRLFVAERNISILRKMDQLVSEDVYVGGELENAIPESVYLELLKKFPNSREMKKYAEARIGACLKEYFETANDTERIYQKYLNKKVPSSGSNIIATVQPQELAKYEMLLEKLNDLLKDSSASENRWQDEILAIVRLLYPKYILAFKSVPIKGLRGADREIDIMLVDANGNVDLIEIKKPSFDIGLVTERTYSNNHVPLRALSGAIMQLEKYILYFNRSGQAGEEKLTEYCNRKHRLPPKMQIRIINPKGIIIMGLETNLTETQIEDFEVIKRKYKNVIDIITYDDLLRRLEFIIWQFKNEIS